VNAPRAAGVDTRAAIRATGLGKRYADLLAVDGLDIEISSGEFFGLLGPNGSGKTTTLHMLATLIRPSAGSATVAGFDVVREPVSVRAAIGLVFQESALDRTLSVAQNLRFAGLLHDLPLRVIGERQGELLELFGIADKRDQPVAALSGGMRRALDIVRGVLHEPRILFLDEPTIGLDLPNRRRIWRFIERLRARTGMTVLLTTHYLEEADGCDRVAFIRRGRLVESGVRFVTANAVSNPPNTGLSAFQIWDTHFDHFRLYDSHLLPELDQALSALLSDLSDALFAGRHELLHHGVVFEHGRAEGVSQVESCQGSPVTRCRPDLATLDIARQNELRLRLGWTAFRSRRGTYIGMLSPGLFRALTEEIAKSALAER